MEKVRQPRAKKNEFVYRDFVSGEGRVLFRFGVSEGFPRVIIDHLKEPLGTRHPSDLTPKDVLSPGSVITFLGFEDMLGFYNGFIKVFTQVINETRNQISEESRRTGSEKTTKSSSSKRATGCNRGDTGQTAVRKRALRGFGTKKSRGTAH